MNDTNMIELAKPNLCDVSWVKDWNVEEAVENFFMLICAKRGSGKTHLVGYIMQFLKDRFKYVYLFSETEFLQDDPYFFVPKSNRFDHFDEEIIEGLLDKQQEIILENKRLPKSQQVDNPILIILDDVIGDAAVRSSKTLKKLSTQGRHSKVSVCALSQSISAKFGFPSVVRGNTDIFISFAIFDTFSRETGSECFLSIIDKKSGMAILDTITTMEDYMACVVNTRAVNPKGYQDFCYKIKAPSTYKKNYMVGAEDRDLKKNAKNDYSKQGMGYVMSGYKEPELGLRFNNGNTKYKPMRIETPVDGTPIQPKIRQVGAKRRLKLNKKK